MYIARRALPVGIIPLNETTYKALHRPYLLLPTSKAATREIAANAYLPVKGEY